MKSWPKAQGNDDETLAYTINPDYPAARRRYRQNRRRRARAAQNALAAGLTIQTITEIKTTLGGARKTFECELLSLQQDAAVVIYRMPADHQLEDLLLPKGSLSLGYFWEGRPYNAYHWVDDKRRTLALYLNICDSTLISPRQITWRDLSVDILITPDLRCRVLDEDELPDDIERNLLAGINATRDSLCGSSERLLREFERSTRSLLAEA